MAKKKEEKKVEMTRAQKTEATKGIIKELLAVKPMKHNELIEETAKLYTERYKSEETENVNDVKGRAGSVLDIMKKESDVMYDGGMYALKARMPMSAPETATEEKPVKASKTKAKKAETEEKTEAPKKRTKKAKAEEPVKTEEVKTEEKAEPKKRGRKPKAKAEEPQKEEVKTQPIAEEKPVEEVKEEPIAVKEEPVKEEPVKEEPAKEELPKEEKKTEQALVVKPKAEVAPKNVVMDMTFLIGDGKGKAPKKEEPKEETPKKEEPKKEEVKAPVKEENKPEKTEDKKTAVKPVKEAPKAPQKAVKTAEKPQNKPKTAERPLSADEKLRDAYLKRMRSLGGDYFEYYSVYLLERYSIRNGRRLEGLRISGGENDGGIDGEIELTDKLGFRETIYIQSKNWNPDKGKEEYWVVGETLLQQFIGACACRQAKDGKQNCRGIFVTTSRFTPEAKRILDDMSDKIVGYDGNDLYDAAKECEFGVIKKNGEWVLDERLLSGTKAFFNML